MNEESENQLGTFVRALSKVELIQELEALVSKTASGTLSLCFPKKVDEEDLHLFVESGKKTRGAEDISLTVAIMDKLGYDHTVGGTEICVRFSPVFNIAIYPHAVSLTKENFENKNIGNFLDEHYPHFFDSWQGDQKVISDEGSSRKIELSDMVAKYEKFVKTASREEIEMFSKVVLAEVAERALKK
jgi:hypothetical protein